MTNSKITRELESNKKGHILFDNQKASDLYKLKKILEEQGKIVVDFPVEEWYKAAAIILSEEQPFRLRAARQFVATKLLSVLEEKYPQLREYAGSKHLAIFQQGDREKFREKSDFIYNLHDVADMLEVEEIHIDRIHFIMNGTRSDNLCDALTPLLSDKTPFDVSIYSSPNGFYTYLDPDSIEKRFISDRYKYTVYKKYEEGVPSDAKAQQKRKRRNETV